jgi:hypothetical protein
VNDGKLHCNKELLVLFYSRNNKSLFTAKFGSAVLMKKTNGLINTPVIKPIKTYRDRGSSKL